MNGINNQYYRDEIQPALVERLQYSNPMEAPRLTKVVVNVGVGEALDDAKALDHAVEDIMKKAINDALGQLHTDKWNVAGES